MASAGVSTRRTCAGCGRRFFVPASSRRKNCTTCRPEKLASGAPVGLPTPSTPAPRGPIDVEAALRETFERAGRMGRYQAVLALRLARQLDYATTVAGAQGLAAQIDALAMRALEGVKPAPDFVDEMADRRQSARKARASG